MNTTKLTHEFFINNGYEECSYGCLHKYRKTTKNPDTCIIVEQEYVPATNILKYSISCWRSDIQTHAIIKRSSISFTDDIEELNNCLKLCNIIF